MENEFDSEIILKAEASFLFHRHAHTYIHIAFARSAKALSENARLAK